MRVGIVALLCCLAVGLSGCGRDLSLGKLSDKLSNRVLKAQVALEDAVTSPAKVREAENDMAERQALDQTQQVLQDAQDAQVDAAEQLQAQQQEHIRQAQADGTIPGPDPTAGRPAEELSSRLGP